MKGVDVIIGGTLAPRSTPACAFAEALNAGIDCVVTVDDLVVLASPVTRRTAYLDVFIGRGSTQTRWLIVDPEHTRRNYTVSFRFASSMLRRVSRQGRIPPRVAECLVWRPL
ncbi:hypothetical protein [Pseudoclavibacter helvolus]|uniref:hypothetical protein n=1 Tax=Pseudoclavibacter helvolus TaxID=255205 RepID=UPI000837CA80|nr:hypothetical protein [Pseudoclavibacter helvolus]